MFMANVAKQKKRSGAKRATRPAVAKKKTVTTAVKKSATAAKKTSTVKKGASVVKKKAVKKSAAKKASKDMTRYRCKLCGYIYSPFRGEPHNGIPAGTSFDDLPDDYVCPICGQEGKGRIGKWGFEEWRPTRYLCSLCNYIYDEKRGEPHRGIKPGTKFEDLPDDYCCPVCALDATIRDGFGKVLKHGFSPLE